MIQAASSLFKESEETWNFHRVPRPVDVEGGPLRVPYIEDKSGGVHHTHRVQRRNVKQNNSCPIPRGAFSFQIHAAS